MAIAESMMLRNRSPRELEGDVGDDR
jgi:hypothetical protein